MRAPDAESGLLAFGRQPRGFGGPRPKRRPGRDRDWDLDRDREAGPLGPAPERRTPMPGRYRLFVRHRSGSLQAAVDEARSRNLAIGFGVLAVLAASIGLLVSSARRARRLSERQMEFVAGVSHELRTPVAVIRAAAQNLADGSVSEPAKVERYGAMVAGEALRLEHLVEEVLELAGIQSSKRQYARECIVARELLETVAARAASELELAQGRIGIHVTDEGLSVTGDRDALERALSNLVRNAIKHGGDGDVELLATRCDDAVVFTVSDRGPGVPDEDRPHVFEAFYRGRRAREGQVKGSGLGLSLVSHIVREHGGEASVRPRAGGGSTFEIRLPESRDAA